MRHIHSSHANRRPGVVLLVVMAMLSLFASVALSFVFYADAEAVAAQFNREAQNKTQADVDPELLANYFLSQFIYGTTNPYSAMRGHSLAETMFGYNPGELNHIPFNGPGRQSYAIAAAGGLDSLNMVNFTEYSTDTFKRTPGFNGIVGDPNYRYVEGTNVPWTAPDRHNMFLSVMASDGTVLMRSYDRPWTGGNASKYTSLRPHSSWHPAFVSPDTDIGGDVRNNDAGLGHNGGNNDSNWMDLGFPVITATNGRKYKALFAPLIVDLSNKLHLWAHGNRLGTSRTHTSNVGMGPTEVNLSRLPGVYGAPIARATMALNIVTITTATPHQFSNGQLVRIAGVVWPAPVWSGTTAYVAGDRVMRNGAAYVCIADNTNQNPVTATSYWVLAYDGAFVVTVLDPTRFTYTAPVGGMPDGAFGVAYFGQAFAELQGDGTTASLFKLKYNKNSATDTGTAIGQPISFPIQRGGPWYSLLDFNALNNAQGAGSRPMFFDFGTAISPLAVTAGSQTINLAATTGTSYGGFHWTIYAGQTLNIIDPQPMPMPTHSESVIVTAVDHVNRTIMVRNPLKFDHPMGIAVNFGSATRGFPTYPPGGYQNLAASELTNDPMALNLRNPNAPNSKALPASQMESLLRYLGTNGPGANSELLKRMPTTFANMATRNQVTTVNWGLDRIAGAPYLTFNRTQPLQFVMDPALKYPKYAAGLNPSDLSAVRPNSDFSADWRNTIGNLPRIDLNRKLTDFPVPVNQTSTFTTLAEITQADKALTDRQQFALDIYNALVRVVGARDPNDPANSTMTTADVDYQASRWLAQLAVNMVDYIDYDDYLTPFKWDTRPMKEEWVFGTELPRLVVSEAYAQYDNDLADPQLPKKMSSYSNLNLWIELDNPFTNSAAGAYPVDTGRTQLKINNTPVYQVVVYQASAALTANLRSAANPRISFGEPDATFDPARLTAAVSTDWGAGADVVVNGTSLYVLGPTQTNFPKSHDPGLGGAVDYASPSMTIRVGADPPPNSSVTILLQRLAVPHLPHQPNPAPPLGSTPYNPFVTIDYLNGAGAADGVPVWDNRLFNSTMMIAAPKTPPGNYSVGRSQPYAADRSQAAPQKGGSGSQPQNTLNRQNSPRASRNEWLVHLDRPAINVIEMVHVSGYRPHELTQQFVTSAGTQQHRVPVGPPVPIHRIMEVLGTANHMAGTYVGGPVPAKLNVNTLMDANILQALLDAQDATQPNPLYTQAQVNALFTKLVFSRSSGAGLTPTNDGFPFRPFNDGELDKTLLRRDPVNLDPKARLFDIGNPGDHEYHRKALLQKMYNNVTTTSNVFAVWFTVGYFEVVDESARPVKLGQEVGRAENRHIRHRFFAIVDRTGLELNRKVNAAAAVTAGVNQAVMLTDPPGVPQPWVIRPGMVVEVIPPAGSTEVGESVVIKAVVMNGVIPGAATIVADFTANHSANSAFVVRGNPGPTDVRNQVNSRSTNVIPAGLDVPVMPNPFSTATWTIQPGMFLQVGSEVVVVKSAPAWDNVRPYVVNDLVLYSGKIYRCTVANSNNAPPNPAFWASDTFTADFTMTQPVSATIGPWRRSYTAKQDANVVLHMSVIQ